MHVTDHERGMHVTGNDVWRSTAEARGTASDLARRSWQQAGTAGEQLYQQGARGSEYLTENIKAPAMALVVARHDLPPCVRLLFGPLSAFRASRFGWAPLGL